MSRKYLNAKALLREYGLQPKKSLGQNFLVDPNGLDKVMLAAGVGPKDTVLEIGAGLGSLTVLLAQAARRWWRWKLTAMAFPAAYQGDERGKNVRIVEGIRKTPA